LKEKLFKKAKPGDDDPSVDKKTPKIILKAELVFHPKYEEVTSNNYCINEEQQSKDNCIS
jgi:hypothetical protein